MKQFRHVESNLFINEVYFERQPEGHIKITKLILTERQSDSRRIANYEIHTELERMGFEPMEVLGIVKEERRLIE